MDTWERTSINDEPTLTPNSGAELCARFSIQNSDLTEADAPPLVFQNPDPATENSEPAEKNVDHLQHSSSTTPVAEVSTPPATRSKTVSSIGSRMVVIFGTLSFAAGVGLGAFLFSKPSWNLHLHASRSAEGSSAAPLANSVQTTPVAAFAPDGSLSEIANQLQSIGSELTSLRQDVRELSSLRQDITSLADELAQISQARRAREQDDYVVLDDKRQVVGRITLHPQAPKD